MDLVKLIRELRTCQVLLAVRERSLSVEGPVQVLENLDHAVREHKQQLIRILLAAEARSLRDLVARWPASLQTSWNVVRRELRLRFPITRLDAAIVAFHEVARRVLEDHQVKYVLGSVRTMQLLGTITIWKKMLEIAERSSPETVERR